MNGEQTNLFEMVSGDVFVCDIIEMTSIVARNMED